MRGYEIENREQRRTPALLHGRRMYDESAPVWVTLQQVMPHGLNGVPTDPRVAAAGFTLRPNGRP